MDIAPVAVLSHYPTSSAGWVREALDAAVGPNGWRRWEVPCDGLPPVDQVRAVVVLGGPMGFADLPRLPWLRAEVALLEGALAQRVPVFGICLGSQLLALAAGGQVRRRRTPEAGWYPHWVTGEGRRFPHVTGWRDGQLVWQLHQDEVAPLPAGATVLTRSAEGDPGAWVLQQGRVLATQFHPEVDPARHASWLEEPLVRQFVARAGRDLAALRAQTGPLDVSRQALFTLFAGWSATWDVPPLAPLVLATAS